MDDTIIDAVRIKYVGTYLKIVNTLKAHAT